MKTAHARYGNPVRRLESEGQHVADHDGLYAPERPGDVDWSSGTDLLTLPFPSVGGVAGGLALNKFTCATDPHSDKSQITNLADPRIAARLLRMRAYGAKGHHPSGVPPRLAGFRAEEQQLQVKRARLQCWRQPCGWRSADLSELPVSLKWNITDDVLERNVFSVAPGASA